MGNETVSVSAVIGWALTDRWLAGAPSGWAVPEVVAWLADRGWDSARLRQYRGARLHSGARWPSPVPADQRAGLGAAQFAAALAQVVAALELDVAVLRDATTPLSAADQHLLADLPPHHGRVG